MADETRLTLTDEECAELVRATLAAHQYTDEPGWVIARAAFAAGRAKQKKRDAESLAAVLFTDSLLDYKTRNRILRRMGIDPETGGLAATVNLRNDLRAAVAAAYRRGQQEGRWHRQNCSCHLDCTRKAQYLDHGHPFRDPLCAVPLAEWKP